jgi:benzoylformate decarboxylase
MPYVTGREAFFEVARSEGARYLFANPGTTELPIFDELAEPEPPLKLIFALQEATAVAAADGYAQATRRPALVNLHIAPGVANGLGNIFNAAWSRSPIVVTAGQQNTNQLIQEPMLAADLVEMTRQFCKWSYEVRRPEDIGVALRRAFKVAASPPTGPVFVSIPWNYLDEGGDTEVPAPSRIDHASPADPSGVIEAVRLLMEAERPLIVAGDEVARSDAVDHVVSLAETLGARVAGEPIHGRTVFPMNHPLWAGPLAPISALLRQVFEQHDLVLVLGAPMFAPFFYSPASAIPPDLKIIQVDPDPWQIAKTYPVTLGLRGDVRATLGEIVEEIRSLLEPGHVKRYEERGKALGEGRAAGVAAIEQAVAAQVDVSPVTALAACAEVASAFEGPTSVVDEASTNSFALRTVLRQGDPNSYFFFRGGGLGWAIPAAAGVQLAQPERRVVAVVGDGATCYVPQALWTLAHHDIGATIVILNNGGYQILKSQLLGLGQKAAAAEVYPGMDIAAPAVDFMSLSRAFGVDAERAEKADDVTAAVRAAIAGHGPRVIEVPIDATVRPLGG